MSLLKRPWLLRPPVMLQGRRLPVTLGEMASKQQSFLSADMAAAGPGPGVASVAHAAGITHVGTHSYLEINDGSVFSVRGGEP